MQLNIPQSSTVSHELPIFTQMSKETKIPISEIKARFRQELIEQHRKAMDNPSILPMDADGDTMEEMAVSSLQQKLEHPEEEVDEDKEYNDMFNLAPGDQDADAIQFSPQIDNELLGFPDEGMNSLDSVADSFNDFGSDMTGGDVNAMSELEPNPPSEEPLPEEGTEENGEPPQEEPAEEDFNLDDLDF